MWFVDDVVVDVVCVGGVGDVVVIGGVGGVGGVGVVVGGVCVGV